MTQAQFQQVLAVQQELISQIADSAARLHESVNQHYDHIHPYSVHLGMVADTVRQYGHEVCASAADVVPMMFGAYYHDSMEDARLTYNDVMRTARQFMYDEQALVATEIVYALTNDKGRTRAERAGERYYAGIRQTPYAPLVKLCDRYANSSYSVHHSNEANAHMRNVYLQELPHFIASISVATDDVRYRLPEALLHDLRALL